MPIFDIFCPECRYEIQDEVCPAGQFGVCGHCGSDMKMRPFVFATDVKGHTIQNDNLDVAYTSTRELETKMKQRGFEPAGDKVHGARNESHLGLGKVHSFAGQTRRG